MEVNYRATVGRALWISSVWSTISVPKGTRAILAFSVWITCRQSTQTNCIMIQLLILTVSDQWQLTSSVSENLADRRRSTRHSSAVPFSPPISRTLRDLNNSIMNYVEPQQQQHNRRRSNRMQTFHDSSIRDDRQVLRIANTFLFWNVTGTAILLGAVPW